MDVQFVVDAFDVKEDGVDGDAQFRSGGFVAVTVYDQFQQAPFVWRQSVVGLRWRRKPLKQVDDLPGDFGRNRRAAINRVTNAVQQLFGRRLFQQIAASPGTQRMKDVIVVFVYGQHQDEHLRPPLFDFPDAFDAGHAGQTDVHQQDIRQIAAELGQRSFHRTERARTAKARRVVNQPRQTFPNGRLVFDDGNIDRDRIS